MPPTQGQHILESIPGIFGTLASSGRDVLAPEVSGLDVTPP
jgi:hypothetical protein